MTTALSNTRTAAIWAFKLIFYLILFVISGVQGIQALRHGTNAGWLPGFVFCSAGNRLFRNPPKALIDGPERAE
jgi:hypothetical protein